MSNKINHDHKKAKKISDLYHTLNQNTQYKIEEQSEADKKLKIRRLSVVKRDERATQITKLLKTEEKSSKKEKYKAGKTPDSKPKKVKEKKATPVKKVVSKPKVLTNKPVDPNKKSRYKLVNDPETLAKDTMTANVWEMRMEGKTYNEISEKLNIPTRTISQIVYARKRQLNIYVERMPHSHKGRGVKGTTAEKVWEMHLAGKTAKEICKDMDLSSRYVSGTLTRRRQMHGIVIPQNPLTVKILELKDKNLTLKEVAEELKMPVPTVKYHYYKPKIRKTKNKQK